MSDLEKRISGDWIDLREASADFYALNGLFKVSREEMLAERQALTLANEEGVTEYKRARLLPVYATLENMLYKALTQEEIEGQIGSLRLLLFVTALQRCVALGTVQLVRGAEAEGPDLEVDLKLVLGDVQDRVKADPSLQKHPAVKNILVLMKRYQGEMAKMRELEPKIKGEAKITFLGNFKETFASITESVKKNYADLMKEARESSLQPESSLARRVPLKALGPVITQQVMAFARMRSTLVYAIGEKFHTRELLAGLHHQKAQVLELLEAELKGYVALCHEHLGAAEPTAAVQFSKSFRDELAHVLERQARLEQP